MAKRPKVLNVIDIDTRKRCGSMVHHQRLMETSIEYRRNRAAIQRFIENYERRYSRLGLRSGIIKIPVVVHVVYNNNDQNIPDSQIESQIDVLNEDYRKLNTDISNIPAVFASLAADPRIEFQLAVRDPNCQPTTGVTRTHTNVTSFTDNDDVKHASKGGHDAWNRDKYLNIWVCNLVPWLGYATFPGEPADTDGVVINYQALGRTGNLFPEYNKGRTATHEIGHWLDLHHVWGDTGGCGDTDFVDDTPTQVGPNYGCPTFPHVTCNNGPNGDMFMNYMDYVDDPCMFMFTAGQVLRMDATLSGARAAIVGSDALVPPPGTPTVDLWMQNTPNDIGEEPDVSSTYMYVSDDIWIRNQNDGVINQDHQNPEYRPVGFGSDFVYVRVRNRGCSGAGSGTVVLYWAKASTALGWPAPWDGSVTTPALMGGIIGSKPTGDVPPGGYTILEFPWYPPNPVDYGMFGADKGHFCLLARIETSPNPPYGMTYPEGSSLWTNVQNNNDIVWKNVTVVDEVPDAKMIGWVTIGNLGNSISEVQVALTAPKDIVQEDIFQLGTFQIGLGKSLYEQLQVGAEVLNMEVGEISEISEMVPFNEPWAVTMLVKPSESVIIAGKQPQTEPRVSVKSSEITNIERIGNVVLGPRDSVAPGSLKAAEMPGTSMTTVGTAVATATGLIKPVLSTSSHALIQGIKLQPKEYHTISVEFSPGKELKGHNVLYFDVNQYVKSDDGDRILGGMRFVVKTKPSAAKTIKLVDILRKSKTTET